MEKVNGQVDLTTKKPILMDDKKRHNINVEKGINFVEIDE